jgi:predicted Zn-dependent peptidase
MRLLNFGCLGIAFYVLFFSFFSRAEIAFDFEEDPIPLVSVSVVLSEGGWPEKRPDSAQTALLSRMWEVGTQTKTNQEFLGQLADYGASISLSIGAQYTFWSLTLPVDSERNRGPLVELLKENWERPRLNDSELGIAKNLAESGLKSVLDKDFGLTSTFLRRWTTANIFKGFPVQIDEIQRAKLADVERKHAQILNAKQAWAGMVGPESSRPWVQGLLSAVFSKQGTVVEKELKEKLPARDIKPSLSKFTQKPKLFILDRKGLNQITIELLALPQFEVSGKQELNFYFGRYLLIESGLGSFITDEIRVKRGISYAVMSPQVDLYGRRVFSLAFNPVLTKQTLAFETLAQVLSATFDKKIVFDNMLDEQWNSSFKSFKYSRLLDRATAEGRLSEKMAVVTGDLSSSLKDSKSEKWKVDRRGITELYGKIWNESFQGIVVLGDADETQSLARKFFPNFEIQVIPYKDSLNEWLAGKSQSE